MLVWPMGLFAGVDQTGPEMDQGVLVGWLNKTIWFPAILATDVMSWDSIDDKSAIGSVGVGDLPVKGRVPDRLRRTPGRLPSRPIP